MYPCQEYRGFARGGRLDVESPVEYPANAPRRRRLWMLERQTSRRRRGDSKAGFGFRAGDRFRSGREAFSAACPASDWICCGRSPRGDALGAVPWFMTPPMAFTSARHRACSRRSCFWPSGASELDSLVRLGHTRFRGYLGRGAGVRGIGNPFPPEARRTIARGSPDQSRVRAAVPAGAFEGSACPACRAGVRRACLVVGSGGPSC